MPKMRKCAYLHSFAHFDDNVKGDGNEGLKENDAGPKGEESSKGSRSPSIGIKSVDPKGCSGHGTGCQLSLHNGASHANDQEQGKVEDNLGIHLPFYATAFGWGRTCIQHRFGVGTRINHNSNDKVSISQQAVPQQHHVSSQGNNGGLDKATERCL